MTLIGRFSIVYDPNEDRLALDAATTDGGTTRLWITQRLVRGLAGALLPVLEGRAPPDEAPAPTPQRTAVQSWEQAAAMADFGKVPGVQPQPETVIGLVLAAHIRPVPQGVVITFDFVPKGQRTVELSPPALRQTLAVIHQLSLAAGWPTDFWPGWITDPGAASAAAPGQIN